MIFRRCILGQAHENLCMATTSTVLPFSGPAITILPTILVFRAELQLQPVQFLQPSSKRQVIRVCHNGIASLRVGKPQGAAVVF